MGFHKRYTLEENLFSVYVHLDIDGVNLTSGMMHIY